ncbi:MAG: DNA-binding response regulator, partial [Actinobacteria bacterium]|nr:DNA-binding response regulator [Actinomycetota bacterium]
ALGGTRREVALRLYVSENTVKTHLRSIYRTLGVADREDALAVARAHDFL